MKLSPTQFAVLKAKRDGTPVSALNMQSNHFINATRALVEKGLLEEYLLDYEIIQGHKSYGTRPTKAGMEITLQ